MIDVGPFEIERRVGEGAMGQVWQGVHRRTRTPVAVKFVLAQGAGAQQAAASVRREAQAIAGLQHPNVVYVYDQGVVDGALADRLEGVPEGSPWIVLELLSGGTLSDKHVETNWEAVRDDLERILMALAHCHARGVLHRDLKPSNVLFGAPRDPRPGLKLVDFGIAGDSAVGQDLQFGTPEFCAPEQLGNEAHAQGPWSDLYAVGALGWTLVTGEVPWPSLSGPPLFMAKAGGDFRALCPRIDVPETLGDWLRQAMAGPPGDRFQSAPDALHALRRLTGSSVGTAPAVRPLKREAAVTRAMLGGEGLSARKTGAPEPAPLVRELIGVPIPPPALRDAGLGLWRHRQPQFTARMPQRVRLWQRLEHAVRDGEVRLVGLRGPRGSGRTRTARWLVEAARVNGGVHALLARAGEPGEALRGLLHQVLRGVPGEQDGRDNARWMLEHHGLTYRSVVDAVERWFDAPRDLTRLRDAAVGVLGSLARGRPVVLVLDDADRDPELLVVARLLQERPTGPMLVVATSSDPLGGPFDEVPDLDPLRRREMSQLLASILPLSVGSSADVVAGSGGLPGRALEIVHDRFDRGLFHHEESGITLDLEPDPPLPLPVLPGPLLDILRRAALLGVFPDRRVVAQSFGNRRRAERAIERAAAVGLLHIEGPVLSFRPGVRQAILADQQAGWSRHHTALARTLPPESAEGAIHRVRGGELQAGFAQLVSAIRAVDQGGELYRMLDVCDRGLALWEEVVGAPADGPWVQLVLQRAEVLSSLRSERLAEVLDSDLERARAHGIWDAVAGLSVERAATDRLGASRDLHFALQVAGTEALRARSLHGLARLAERRNDVPLARHWLLAAARLVDSEEREAVGQARIARARLASMDEDYELATEELEAAIRLRSVPGELDLLAAGVHLARGSLVEARSALLRGVHWMGLRRDRRWLPTALVRLALVDLLEGNQDQAEARLAEADRIQAENQLRFGTEPALTAAVRLVLTLERGEWFRAMEALGHLRDVAWRRPTRVAVFRRVEEILDIRDDVPVPVREALERSLSTFEALRDGWFTR